MIKESYIKNKDLIEAWASGSIIQYYSDSLNCWIDSPNPVWDFETKYRIKPDYVPFDNNIDIKGKVISFNQNPDVKYIIRDQDENSVLVAAISNVLDRIQYRNLLERFIFEDKTPCGIKN